LRAVGDFFGVWALDADACDYGDQPPPLSGIYSLVENGEGLYAHARWVDAEGERQEAAFVMIPDGQPRPMQGGLTLTAGLRDGVLESEVSRDGEVLHVARRTLSDDGQRLSVAQTLDGGAANTLASYRRVGVKQVLVYRRDLKMRKGKIAAQCAHASMAVFFQRNRGGAAQLHVPLDGPMSAWVSGRFTKVVLCVESEEALLQVHQEALARGLPTALITDSGRTEFGGVPTRTAVAIGPAATTEIDVITGREGLVPTRLP